MKQKNTNIGNTLDTLLEGYQIIDPNWRYIYLNNAAIQQSHTKADKLLGRTMMSCYPGIEKTEMFSCLKRCMEHRVPMRMDNAFTYPDGKKRWFDLRMEPVPQGVLILSTDITAQKVVQEHTKQQHAQLIKSNKVLTKFKLAVDSASDMIIITDAEGRVIHLNKSYQKMTEFTLKDAVGKDVALLWRSPVTAEFYRNLWRKIVAKKQAYQGDVYNMRKDGQEYEARLAISPVVDKTGSLEGFINIERDITREKEIDRAKTEFVFLASHQLRTPTSTIKWACEDLLTNKLPPEKKLAEGIRQIAIANERMIRVVDTMLYIARMEAGTADSRPVPTNPLRLARQELSIFRSVIHHKKLKVAIKCSTGFTNILADKACLEVIFHNLLSNAIKYTPNQGKVALTIVKAAKTMKLQITDTGVGIPDAQKSRIFSKMFRADNVRAIDTDGNGLGLYLVKLLVKHAGGTIRFTSRENKGTTFYITFPLQPKKT